MIIIIMPHGVAAGRSRALAQGGKPRSASPADITGHLQPAMQLNASWSGACRAYCAGCG